MTKIIKPIIREIDQSVHKIIKLVNLNSNLTHHSGNLTITDHWSTGIEDDHSVINMMRFLIKIKTI